MITNNKTSPPNGYWYDVLKTWDAEVTGPRSYVRIYRPTTVTILPSAHRSPREGKLPGNCRASIFFGGPNGKQVQ